MYKTLMATFFTLLIAGTTLADKPKSPNKGVASVTSYTPVAGDVLDFEFLNQESKKIRQQVTIAKISSDTNLAVLDVKSFEVVDNGKDVYVGKMQANWTARKNFLGELAAQDYRVSWKTVTISNKRLSCCVVTLGVDPATASEIWIVADKATKPATKFPGLVLFKVGKEVRFKLLKIQSKSKSKSKSKSSGK